MIATPEPSQADQILAHLEEGKELTPMDALDLFGCMRLAARIWDLRHERGVAISERRLRLGLGKWVTVYFIAPKEPEAEAGKEAADA